MNYFEDEEINKLFDRELIIFDMNGLIIFDEPVQIEAFNAVLPITLTKNEWKTYVGWRSPEIFADLIKKHNIDATPGDLTEKKNKEYEKLMETGVKHLILPGVLDLLSSLEGKRLALVTGALSKEVEIVLDGIGIRDRFEIVLDGTHVSKAKPDPEIYEKVLKMANVEAKDAISLEDSGPGVTSSTKAEIDVIAVPNEFTEHQDFSKALVVLSDLTSSSERIL